MTVPLAATNAILERGTIQLPCARCRRNVTPDPRFPGFVGRARGRLVMSEIWKPVVGFEGRYEVSDLGRVRSLDRFEVYTRRDQYSGRDLVITRKHRGRLLRPGPRQSGHLSVLLGREEGSRSVHSLVLEAFVGPCPEGHECCHDNDVPDDNRLGNLSWGTRSKNLLDAVRNGKKAIGDDWHRSKLRAADIPTIRKELLTGEWGVIRRLADQYGVSGSTIRQVRDRKAWKHIA